MLEGSKAQLKATKSSRILTVPIAPTLVGERTFGIRKSRIEVLGTADDDFYLGLGQSIFCESGGRHKRRQARACGANFSGVTKTSTRLAACFAEALQCISGGFLIFELDSSICVVCVLSVDRATVSSGEGVEYFVGEGPFAGDSEVATEGRENHLINLTIISYRS